MPDLRLCRGIDLRQIAGNCFQQVGELPRPGDHVVWAGWRFEVVDMDGRRIDMILARSQPEH